LNFDSRSSKRHSRPIPTPKLTGTSEKSTDAVTAHLPALTTAGKKGFTLAAQNVALTEIGTGPAQHTKYRVLRNEYPLRATPCAHAKLQLSLCQISICNLQSADLVLPNPQPIQLPSPGRTLTKCTGRPRACSTSARIIPSFAYTVRDKILPATAPARSPDTTILSVAPIACPPGSCPPRTDAHRVSTSDRAPSVLLICRSVRPNSPAQSPSSNSNRPALAPNPRSASPTVLSHAGIAVERLTKSP